MQIIPLLMLVVLMAITIIPRRRRMAEQRALIDALAVGDRVMFAGGMFGVIESLAADVLGVRVAPTTVLHIARGAVSRILTDANTDVPTVAAFRGELGQEDVS